MLARERHSRHPWLYTFWPDERCMNILKKTLLKGIFWDGVIEDGLRGSLAQAQDVEKEVKP